MNEVETEGNHSPSGIITREFADIIVEYITKVSSRYRGNEFTSSQLAKTVMSATELDKTRFPIVHRAIKEILRTWERRGLCIHIARTKYSRCRKTKDVYRFNEKGLREAKRQALEGTIKTIERRESETTPIMRTRNSIIRDRFEELLKSVTAPTPTQDSEM